ncbi:MAG: serine hydrolase [Bacteroidota bacterium]
MTPRFFFCIGIILFLHACQTKEEPATGWAETGQQILDSLFNANPEAQGIILSIEQAKTGRSWTGAVGFALDSAGPSLEANQPVLLASNTKTYVSAAILRLAEQNKLRVDQPISELLTAATQEVLRRDTYELEKIQVAHLLSHTSGIADYVSSPEYNERIQTDPMYHWTRGEQIALAVSAMDKVGPPGKQFQYADVNYLLLTEIIEQLTEVPFYTAMRKLLNYEQLGLTETWFIDLEQQPKGSLPLAVQSMRAANLNTQTMSKTFDLYGGGGIAAPMHELRAFVRAAVTGQVFDDPATAKRLLTNMDDPSLPEPTNYYFGIGEWEIAGHTAYGHGGFWGTTGCYIPSLDVAASVAILEHGKRELRPVVLSLAVEKMVLAD